ncbi:MAG TPA: hypothetical protein VL137_10230 [Polyangiaceae bacterium]|nr:hypothetical protein [Polyangiaceae bacterium]
MSDDFDLELERLKAATAKVTARPDFSARVMAAVDREHNAVSIGLLEQLGPSARRVLPWFATIAAVIVLWATQVQPDADDQFTVDYGAESSLSLAYADVQEGE